MLSTKDSARYGVQDWVTKPLKTFTSLNVKLLSGFLTFMMPQGTNLNAMYKLTITLWAVLTLSASYAQNAFISQWNTALPGVSTPYMIRIPLAGSQGFTYDFFIDWGDGEIEHYSGNLNNVTHTYAVAGIKTVSITGAFPAINFFTAGDHQKLLSIQQWGTIQWQSFAYAFRNCSNLVITAVDAPDLSNVASMRSMFEGCTALATLPTLWDVSSVTNFRDAFNGASTFIGGIEEWTPVSATTFEGMFKNTASFNADITGWEVGSVSNFNGVFQGASAFNQDLSSWNITSATSMSNMFDESNLSTCNYDAMLVVWAQLALQPNVTLGAIGVEATQNSAFPRALMENVYNWNFVDDGMLLLTYNALTDANMLIQQPTCTGANDASIDLNLNSGVPPYQTTWFVNGTAQPGETLLTDLSPATYSATISDAIGCHYETGTVEVVDPEPVEIIAIEITHPLCNGSLGQANLSAQGGTNGYTYQWLINDSVIFNGLPFNGLSGDYNVVVSDDNGCTVTEGFTITEPPLLTVSGQAIENAITIAPSGGTPPYEVAWTGPNGFASTAFDLQDLENGFYTCFVSDANGCEVTEQFTIFIIGVPHTPSTATWRLFPNPVIEHLSIEATARLNLPARIQIWSSLGQKVMDLQLREPTTSISFAHLQLGYYLLMVTDAHNQVHLRERIVKASR
jgi:hypothetical protein